MLLTILSTPTTGQEEAEAIDMENNMEQAEENLRDLNESIGQGQRVRLSVNTANASALESLHLLSPEQIIQFLLFRKTFGPFISLMELQAIPYWDTETIKKLLPHLIIHNESLSARSLVQQIKQGEHVLLYRTGGKFPGSNATAMAYKQLLGYRFRYQDGIQWGVTTEKDSGEKAVFDHTSAYLVIRKKGLINTCVLGDFLVNMGQGLVHWQGHAFGKSSNILQGYRQAALFKPHTGTDENQFHRGVAISLQQQKLEWSFFASQQKIDANIATDNISGAKRVTSFLRSGLHRTPGEIEDKHALPYSAWGGRLRYEKTSGRVGINFISHHYAIPIEKRALVNNTHAISGKQWQNMSIDFAHNSRWGFLFGEGAVDSRKKTAVVIGLMKSIHPKLDLSIIHRNIAAEFKSVASNALTQQTEASNEKGFFACINFVPEQKHRFEGFADRYTNPWPLYQHDGPRRGRASAVQYSWNPTKKIQFSLRWAAETKTGNTTVEDASTRAINHTSTQRMRFHVSAALDKAVTLRCRTEMVWIKKENTAVATGSLGYIEVIVKPQLRAFSFSSRFSVFDTEGYGTRIYAYERDLPSYFAIPAHYGSGQKIYMVCTYSIKRNIQIACKWASGQRTSPNTQLLAQVQKNTAGDWRLQVIWNSSK